MRSILVESARVREIRGDSAVVRKFSGAISEDSPAVQAEEVRLEHFRDPQRGVDVRVGFAPEAEESIGIPFRALMKDLRDERERAEFNRACMESFRGELERYRSWQFRFHSAPWWKRLWWALRNE